MARRDRDLVQLFARGLASHDQGQLAEAERIYGEVLRRKPGDVHALYQLGSLALQTNRAGLAVRLLMQAAAANGRVAAIQGALGCALLELRRADEAVACFDRSIALEPGHAEDHYNRGKALQMNGRHAEAVTSYDRAIELRPDLVEAHNNRGIALSEVGHPEAAIESYDTAIAVRPNFADAHFNRGSALRRMGRFEEAMKSLDAAIERRADFAEAWFHRGLALNELNRHDDALASFDQAIARKPDHAEAHLDRGAVLQALSRHEEALASYDRAIAARPDYAEAHYNRGLAARDLRRHTDALASYDRAIAINPGYAEAWSNRGITLTDLNRHAEALASFDTAIRCGPNFAAALINRGTALRNLGEHQAALDNFDATIAINPDHAEAHVNRAVALRELNRHDEALASCDRAIELNPVFAEAHGNRGSVLLDMNRHAEALASLDMAITLKPDLAIARFNKACLLLLLGSFDQGWRQYEWRSKLDEPSGIRPYEQPAWSGEADISGKTLFVYWEQGFGDTIQFCRYARLLHAKGTNVILSVQDRLSRLVRRIDTGATIIGETETPERFDYHCPLLSLPLALATTLATIPSQPRYIAVDDAWRDGWSARLPPATMPKIGLVWRGGTVHKNDANRSIDPRALQPLLSAETHWISLAKELPQDDLNFLREDGRIRFFGDAQGDFADAAALIDEMDLVITVDTAVAHLAGAMGKPVWILLSFAPDWRWMLNRTDSPWYQSARLFRQTAVGDWTSVIAAVRSELDRVLRTGALASYAGSMPGR